MKIGEIARELGTTVTALRFYENKGLVKPKRSAKGTRLYDEETLLRFEALLDLTALDIPLEQIHRLTGIRNQHSSGDSASREVEIHLNELELALQKKLHKLQHNLADIQNARVQLEHCHGCTKQPTRTICASCPDSPALLSSQVMHLVWDEETP
ncbi:MAG: MerR family transcriptional regulator [Gammaproteobacteria bacterium]|nr:MerR family transcriptional regulator [Gammaproteobacteria bacterium]